MGQINATTCQDCGHHFELRLGGGFIAQVVFCEECGRGEAVFHGGKSLGERDDEPGWSGRCPRCHGRLSLRARARCPRCRSTRLDVDEEPTVLWD